MIGATTITTIRAATFDQRITPGIPRSFAVFSFRFSVFRTENRLFTIFREDRSVRLTTTSGTGRGSAGSAQLLRLRHADIAHQVGGLHTHVQIVAQMRRRSAFITSAVLQVGGERPPRPFWAFGEQHSYRLGTEVAVLGVPAHHQGRS